jgi:hypothetical protein
MTITERGVSSRGGWQAYGAGEDGHTTRNRGTEFMKSPEMLTVANASAKDRATFDRRKQVPANPHPGWRRLTGTVCLLTRTV